MSSSRTSRSPILGVLVAALALSLPMGQALAQEDFFEGKILELYLPVSTGGALDLHARLFSPYLQRHIPGNPDIIVRNMPGAGGMVLANHMYNNAPQDGTAIANFLSYFAISQAVGTPEVQYDAAQFSYVGSLAPINSVLATWNATTGADNYEDLIEIEGIRLGSTGPSSITNLGPVFANRFAGANFNVISGYQGTAGIMQAIENGELHGRVADYEGLIGPHPDWIENNLVSIHFHTGLEPDSALPDTPRLMDFAQDDTGRAAIEFLGTGSALGRVYVAPPNVPADILEIVRQGFMDAAGDPEYLALMEERALQVDPRSGVWVEGVIEQTLATPEEILALVRDVFLGD